MAADFRSLTPFARTEYQKKVLERLVENPNQAAAAKHFGCTRETIKSLVSRVVRHAAVRGWSPDHDQTRTLPETQYVKGVSGLYRRGEEEPILQWVKSAASPDIEASIREMVEALSEPIRGLAKPIKLSAAQQAALRPDLQTLYPIGDAHVGMLAWGEETGEDFDLKIAESNLVRVSSELVRRADPSETAVVLNLGDFFHVDDRTNRTPAGGHALDADSRWGKMIRVGVRTMKAVIETAKRKHARVSVYNIPGNHDPHASAALGMILAEHYRSDPRVHVDTTPGEYAFWRFGECLFGATHKPRKSHRMLETMQAMRREDMLCRWKHWHVGHVHHKEIEIGGCVVESHNILAPADAYHVGAGYHAQRYAQAICYHERTGEYSRIREIV